MSKKEKEKPEKKYSIISKWYEPIPTMYPLAAYPLPPKKQPIEDLFRTMSARSRNEPASPRKNSWMSKKSQSFRMSASRQHLLRTLSHGQESSGNM